MTTSISMHPQSSSDCIAFKAKPVTLNNANCLRLVFSSFEFNDKSKNSPFTIDTEFTVFDLDLDTAQCLSMVGQLDLEYRAKLVPILEHMLAEQNATGDSDG